MKKMETIKNVPFQFKNELKEGKHVLTLSGNIRKKYWSDDDVIDAKSVRDTLDSVTSDIVIKLNSPGGDVFEGIEIYNYLKTHASKITVEVTGLAASAATFILMAADEATMNIGTSVMIHEASTFAWGNKQEIQKTMNALETIDDSILSIYADKTGQSTEQLKEWMNEEKWFTADEAVKFGFADSVKRETPKEEPENLAAIIQDAVAVAMANVQLFKNKQINKHNQPKSLLDKLRKGE
ncbi:endopeptidase Clp [Enterococcus faecium LA4B-2]|nr:endopeptidase Clp [Enterococcus faecium LA4B-2]